MRRYFIPESVLISHHDVLRSMKGNQLQGEGILSAKPTRSIFQLDLPCHQLAFKHLSENVQIPQGNAGR